MPTLARLLETALIIATIVAVFQFCFLPAGRELLHTFHALSERIEGPR